MVLALRQPSDSTKPNDSCRLQFNKTKLERAEKRKSRIEDNTAASKKFTRQSIEEAPPSTKTCFFCGKPPVRETLRKKTTHVFSGIAIDQAHEQNNASVKGDGGGVGLTENPAALRRWMVTGPEMARLIGKFEVSTMKKKKTDFRHHEQTKHAQMTFGRDITSLTGVIEQMGNPFAENSNDLLLLDSRDLADPAVIDTLRQIKSLGQEQ